MPTVAEISQERKTLRELVFNGAGELTTLEGSVVSAKPIGAPIIVRTTNYPSTEQLVEELKMLCRLPKTANAIVVGHCGRLDFDEIDEDLDSLNYYDSEFCTEKYSAAIQLYKI